MISKIHKAVSAVFQLVRNPYLLNHVLDEEVYWRKKVVHRFGFSDGLPVIDIADLFPGFSQVVAPYAFLDGSCTPPDLALLRGLAEKYQVGSYLEIGTWRGESVANVAPLVRQAISMNLPDDEMRAMGRGEDYIGLHRFFSEGLPNVVHVQANSRTFDFKSLENTFDMVFIDGDHHYEMVRSDTRKVLGVLTEETGIIVWHDYARNPEQVRWSVLAGILEGLPENMRRHVYHVSNTLCAVYLPNLPKHVKAGKLQPNARPGKWFEVSINVKSNQE
jgi:predicted O-methyltransferase YrrM